MRTMKGIDDLFQPLEDEIQSTFLPILTDNYQFSENDRCIYSLPVKFGGLGIFNPVKICKQEYGRSLKVTKPLVDLIKEQQVTVSKEKLKRHLIRSNPSKTH